MSCQIRNKLPKSYKCTKCTLTASPLLVCSLLHKICGKCYDLFCHPTIICPICKLEFTSIEDFTNEQSLPALTKNTEIISRSDSDDLINELLCGLDNPAFSVAKENEDTVRTFYENRNNCGKSKFLGYGAVQQSIERKEETSNRQIRKLCFMALWNTATSVFGNGSRKSKDKASPAQFFSNLIMNSLVRRMGTPVFLVLENHGKNPRSRNHALCIGGGVLVLLFILGYCTKSTKK